MPFSAIGPERSDGFDPPAPQPADPGRHADAVAEVASLLSLLARHWRFVLALRYGLGGHEPQTLKDVGRRLGVTKQAVQAMQSLALERLARRALHRGRPGG